MIVCDVCKQPAFGFVRTLARGVHVCGKCNPFMRCGATVLGMVCLGEMKPAGTAKDQTLHECELCGRTERK